MTKSLWRWRSCSDRPAPPALPSYLPYPHLWMGCFISQVFSLHSLPFRRRHKHLLMSKVASQPLISTDGHQRFYRPAVVSLVRVSIQKLIRLSLMSYHVIYEFTNKVIPLYNENIPYPVTLIIQRFQKYIQKVIPLYTKKSRQIFVHSRFRKALYFNASSVSSKR